MYRAEFPAINIQMLEGQQVPGDLGNYLQPRQSEPFFELFEGSTSIVSEKWRSFALSV